MLGGCPGDAPGIQPQPNPGPPQARGVRALPGQHPRPAGARSGPGRPRLPRPRPAPAPARPEPRAALTCEPRAGAGGGGHGALLPAEPAGHGAAPAPVTAAGEAAGPARPALGPSLGREGLRGCAQPGSAAMPRPGGHGRAGLLKAPTWHRGNAGLSSGVCLVRFLPLGVQVLPVGHAAAEMLQPSSRKLTLKQHCTACEGLAHALGYIYILSGLPQNGALPKFSIDSCSVSQELFLLAHIFILIQNISTGSSPKQPDKPGMKGFYNRQRAVCIPLLGMLPRRFRLTPICGL